MRSIQHPGRAERRSEAVPADIVAFETVLAPRLSLLAAVQAAFDARGATSGVARLAGGRFTAWPYVMPALSGSAAHAVYFSHRHEALAPVQLQEATITYGRRGGRPWLHAHADWIDAAGQRHCGHVLPDEALVAEDHPAPLSGWALRGAGYEVLPDAQTNFSLFRPVAAGAPPAAAHAVVLRLSPNLDLCHTLEALCHERGWTQACVRGGVGSTVGAAFDDGRVVEPFVTETLIRHGVVRPGRDGRLHAEIDVTLIDHLGGRHQGRLARGENAVLVTFELLLERG